METLGLYLLIFGVFFVLGTPIVLALSVSAIVLLLMSGIDLLAFASKFMTSMDNYSLTAMFFFILAGEFMNRGGMTNRIVSVVSRRLGRIPGGLAIVALVSCALFAAINGSAIATMVAIGAILYPAMVKEGYPPAFAAAVLAAGGVVGPIIPPSIPLILYGSITGDSIAALFAGGVGLGILIVLGECVLVAIVCKKRGYGSNASTTDFGSSKGVVWALLFPVLMFVSIVSGAMTATETSALAVLYAWAIGTFVYREFKWRELGTVVLTSMKSSGSVMAIVGAATAVAFVLTYRRVPQDVAEGLVNNIGSPLLFMLATFGIVIVVGMIMDLTPAILILSPIFMAPVASFGVDSVYFGVFFCAVLTAGLITPPVGTLIYLGCNMSGEKLGAMVREVVPHAVVIFLLLAIAIVFPQLITFVPKLLGLY